ncbi:MAG: hypothetical protein ISP91_09525 [Pseudomonadales bacterium]|jgi:hypothetical protein|nr:hypothetical protein [Pseudomonadales bacterium]
MARIRLKENDELEPHIRELAEKMDAQGVDTSNLRGFAHRQDMFDSYFQFYGPAREGKTVEAELIELVRLKIARHNDCFT